MFKSFIATPSNVLSFSLLKGSLSFLLEDDVEVDELSGSLWEFALVDMYLMFKRFIATPSNVLSFSLLKGSLSFLLEDDVEVDELSGSLWE